MSSAREHAQVERRRQTKGNLAVRRMIDVLGWATAVPTARYGDARRAIDDTRESALAALRRVAH
jgi:hypothetical protein